MNWDMRDASNVRFLAVRGTIWVGDCQTTYNFTLVEYQLYIDEVPWLLFSTLADVLEKEFIPGFWETVNYSRKERRGFLELPWDGKAYGVAPPYTEIRLSIFNDIAHTMRVVHPFVWNHTHLKVHPNGAAIFHEQKKLAFLLPLIVEAHELLPPTPLFWVNDDNTIPLWRTTLWLHEDTIQWLAETGESYPPELRDEIQPRLNQLKPSQHAKCHNLRLHRNQPGGRTELQQNSRYKHYKKPLHRTRRVLRTRHNRWLIENGNIWNCNLSLLKQTNGRWQTADQRIPNKPKNDPTAVPHASPWNLCAAGNLGSMESNVMAGRALFGCLQLPDGQRRCAIFLVHEKVTQGASRAADYRAYRRIAPKLLELVVVSKPVAFAFCGRLLLQQPAEVEYFDPASDWPQPIELHATFPIVLEELAFLGDTRSRCELLVFAQANPARLPLTMGILQPDIPVRRMISERRTKLTDALVRVLRRFLTPIGVALPGVHDCYMRDCLLALAGHGDGHVLTVAVALLLAILTGRSDLCIAGVFGAGKTRSLAVLLIALSCELDDFYAVVYTKENVAAKALADQISDLSPPTQSTFGRLLGRIEEGKGEAYATQIDVRCSDRNRVIAEKRILIATGGSATAEMAMKYSSFSLWLSRTWLAFMDESQQYGNYHEIAALAAIQQPALIVFVGDHRQTPGGLSKGRAAAANRQKLLHRPLGLRALNRSGDYLPPARLAKLIARLWPDASQDDDSDVACLLNVGQAPHTGVWTAATTTQHLPTSLARLFSEETLSHLNVASCLISAILAVLLIATAPEEFGIPECTTTVEAAGLDGPHRPGIILPNSSRVSLLTYKAIVAVRYPELVLHDQDPIQIGHFVPHDHTVEHGGFRAVLWEAPKELRAAVEDVVVFLNYLQKCHRDLSQGATAQLLVMCNRTAVHNQLLQHGFQAAWFGGLRIATTSSAAGATARIAVVVQTGCGFLSGGRGGACLEDREDCFGRATVSLTRAIRHTYIVSPIDMAGMIGMAQTLAVYHYGYHTLKNRLVQYNEPTREPSDAEAVLEWGLDTPFTSQDKPPLAVAMVVTLNGVRSLRRYRLVVAQKSKLRLTQEVTAALASHSREHRLTASGFFPCSIDREYLYGYAGDGYRSPLWLCVSYNGSPVLVHRLRGNKIIFIRPSRIGGS